MSSDPSVELIRALVDNLEDAPDDWVSFAMVLSFDGERVNSVYGFAYAPDGSASAVTASPYELRGAVKQYMDSHYADADALPLRILVQFDRVTRQYEITFEDTDPRRWRVTPKNLNKSRDELRPHFS